MVITVELMGAARSIAGQKTVRVELNEWATYREVVRFLGRNFPDLIGVLIAADGETFLSSNMLVINGDLTTPAMVLEDTPRDGDHLLLMSLITGG